MPHLLPRPAPMLLSLVAAERPARRQGAGVHAVRVDYKSWIRTRQLRPTLQAADGRPFAQLQPHSSRAATGRMHPRLLRMIHHSGRLAAAKREAPEKILTPGMQAELGGCAVHFHPCHVQTRRVQPCGCARHAIVAQLS